MIDTEPVSAKLHFVNICHFYRLSWRFESPEPQGGSPPVEATVANRTGVYNSSAIDPGPWRFLVRRIIRLHLRWRFVGPQSPREIMAKRVREHSMGFATLYSVRGQVQHGDVSSVSRMHYMFTAAALGVSPKSSVFPLLRCLRTSTVAALVYCMPPAPVPSPVSSSCFTRSNFVKK